jgi:hypothetical protein
LEGKSKIKNNLNKKLSRTERKKIKKEEKKLNANTIQTQKDNLSLTENTLKKNTTMKHLYDKPLNFFNNKPISYFM